MTIADITF